MQLVSQTYLVAMHGRHGGNPLCLGACCSSSEVNTHTLYPHALGEIRVISPNKGFPRFSHDSPNKSQQMHFMTGSDSKSSLISFKDSRPHMSI
jgi:hypothetical protein